MHIFAENRNIMGEQILNSVLLLDAAMLTEKRAGKRNTFRIDSAAMLFVTSGNGILSINLDDKDVAADDFVSIVQGAHLVISDWSHDFRGYFINFSTGFTRDLDLWKNTMDSMVTMVENPVIRVEQEEKKKLITSYCNLLYEIYSAEITYKQEVVKNMLEGAMFAISGFYHDRFGSPEATADGSGKTVKISRRHDIYKRFLELVAKSYEDHRDVAFYADNLCITPKHLGYVVKSASGKLASETIADAVVLDAKSKLKSSSMAIGEISDSLSFPNPSFFCKYFKKHVGMTPKQYRDTARS